MGAPVTPEPTAVCGSRTVASSTIVALRFDLVGGSAEMSSRLMLVPGTCTSNEKNWRPTITGAPPSVPVDASSTQSQLSRHRSSA